MRRSLTFFASPLIAALLMSGAAYAQGAWHGHGQDAMDGMFAKLHDQLQLNTEQEQAWQTIQAQSRALRQERKAGFTAIRQAMQQELAKPEPDLARIAQLRDQYREKNMQAEKALEQQKLSLYAGMTSQQKNLVGQALRARMAKMEQRMAAHKRAARGQN